MAEKAGTVISAAVEAVALFISSLGNDKDVSIAMTDVEEAETHGFDKYSFRHPTK